MVLFTAVAVIFNEKYHNKKARSLQSGRNFFS